MSNPKRVLFKISGEALSKEQDNGIDDFRLSRLVSELGKIRNQGIEPVVVVGGGNIFRGLKEQKDLSIKRISADQMGMLATLINGMALSDALNTANIPCSLTSTLSCPQVADLYSPQKALENLEKGLIVICTTGTGAPFVTTDTAAAIRACELNVSLLIKATMNVDGIYDKDPITNPDAKRFDSLTYKEYLDKGLQAMDASAVSLCMDAKIPIKLFNFQRYSLEQALHDDFICSIIKE